MLFYIVITLLGCFIIITFFHIKLAMEIQLTEYDEVQTIGLYFKVFFFKYRRSFDYSDPKLHLWEALLVDLSNSRLATDKDFNMDTLLNIFRKIEFLSSLLEYKEIFLRVFYMALGYTVVERLQWKTIVGGEDAMHTALRTGFLWSLKGWLAAFLSHHSNLEKLNLAVEPDFMKTIFTSKFICILKIRIVHIITIAIHILVWKVRWWKNGITARAAAEQPSH